MNHNAAVIFFLMTTVASLVACKEEAQQGATVGTAPGGLTFNGSEVETAGGKTRLIGCAETDADCLKRNEIVTKLGCDWLSPEDCKGCSKLDAGCLERIQAEGK